MFSLLLLSCRDNLYLDESRFTKDNIRNYTSGLCSKEIKEKILSIYACMEANRLLSGEIEPRPDGQYNGNSILHLSKTRLLVNGIYDMETYGSDLYSEGQSWKVNKMEVECTDAFSLCFRISNTDYHCECDLIIDSDTDSLRTFSFSIMGEDPKTYESYHSDFSAIGTASVPHKRQSENDIYIPTWVNFGKSNIFQSTLYYGDEVLDNCVINNEL